MANDVPDVRTTPGLPAPAVVALCACAIVATGGSLGADWLRAIVLGLPAGLWIVLGATAFSWVRARRLGATSRAMRLFESHGARPIPIDGPAGALALHVIGPALAWLVDRARTACDALWVPAERRVEIERRLAAWLESAGWPERPLRIGVDLPLDVKLALTSRPGLDHVTWVSVAAGTHDQADCAHHDLDALVRQPPTGHARVTARIDHDREAAWYDWTTPRPITYAAVFPGRVDPERVTLADLDWRDPDHADLAARIAEAVALHARHPARVGLAGRLRGRRLGCPASVRLSAAMASLGGTPAGEEPTPTHRGVARAVGAFFAGDFALAEIDTRSALVNAAASTLPDEPEAVLRQAAVRFGALEDDEAIDLILHADTMLRDNRDAGVVDHLPFLQSEVEHGLPGPLTLGRVAAGICLVCATTPAERLDLLRDDLLDDLRYSGWLVGRDNDRAVLIEVFRRLVKARSTDLSQAA